MSPRKHAAICAEIQQRHQLRESELLARIVKLEAQRKPLTDEQIADIVVEMNGNEPTALFWRDLARAIEAAHGIKEEDMSKSGFQTNPIGYTGFICGPRNPATNDCFWQSRILEEKEDKFFVELEDGQKGWIAKHQFTPMAMRIKE